MFMFSKVIVSFLGIEIWPMVVWLCGLELGINCIAKACTRHFTLFMVCAGASLCTTGTINGNGHEIKFETSKLRIVVAFTELLNILWIKINFYKNVSQVKFLEKYLQTLMDTYSPPPILAHENYIWIVLRLKQSLGRHLGHPFKEHGCWHVEKTKTF